MIDKIAAAYKQLKKKQEQVKEYKKEDLSHLPELYDGKFPSEQPERRVDNEPLQEAMTDNVTHPEHDDFDKASLQNVLDSINPDEFKGTIYHEHDKAIHDMLKGGLNAEKYFAIRHITHNLPYNEHGDASISYVRQQLMHKYDFLNKYMTTPHKEYSPEENFLTKEEIDKQHEDGYQPVKGRQFQHKSTRVMVQLHHNGERTISPSLMSSENTAYAQPEGSVKERSDELQDHYGDHIEKFKHPDGSKLASHVHMYTSDSKEVNTYLAKLNHGLDYDESEAGRQHSNESLENHADALSEGIRHAPPLDKDTTVYTGISEKSHIFTKSKQGKETVRFHAPTFMSTSLSHDTASSFAKQKIHHDDEIMHTSKEPNEFGRGYISDVLKINLPKGFKGGMYVESHSANKSENEMLLDKGHVFNIHPTPKYYSHARSLVRLWDAHIEPKKYEDE